MASGVFDKDTSWTCLSGMRLKWKSWAVIPFSRLCLWLKQLYLFCILCCNPKTLPGLMEKPLKATFCGSFHIQHGNSVSTQSASSNPPLTSGGKELGVQELNQWRSEAANLLMCWIRAETELNYKMAPIAHSFDVKGGGMGAEVEVRRDKKSRRGTIMFKSEGEDEGHHHMQPLRLFNSDRRELKTTTKACGQKARNLGDELSNREEDVDVWREWLLLWK